MPRTEINNPAVKGRRGTKGFGSTDICWTQLIPSDKPYMTLMIQGRTFIGLIDTGADISVIAKQYWPHNWPLTDSDVPIKGVGQARFPVFKLVHIRRP